MVETLFKVLSGMEMRIVEKEIALKELEVFKLEMCKKYMNSELLEPRINGIRELN